MSSHPFESTRRAIVDGDSAALEYNALAFKYAGCCSLRKTHGGVHAWTRGGVRLRENLRWWHLCRECWDRLVRP